MQHPDSHPEIADLFEMNRAWAKMMTMREPGYFERLSAIQAPKHLWIGCADSRVPANEIVGLPPGEIFVHRNIANVVVHTDLNCLSVIQYAVQVLKVQHVIVCGHYGCGGVIAATKDKRYGMIDNWLRHIQDVASLHQEQLAAIEDERTRTDRLCELNVIQQVVNVCKSSPIQDAWDKKQPVAMHGWVYSLKDGLIRDLGITASNEEELEARYKDAIVARTDKTNE